MSHQILIAESAGFSSRALARLSTVGSVVSADLDRAQLLSAVATAEVLWIRLRHQIDAEVFRAASKLRILASPTTGLDHIDLVEAEIRGVRVISLREAKEFLRDVRATAELAIGLMLSLLRHIPQAKEDVVAGHWDRDRFKGSEIRGKTIGIVGFGRLGQLVATYLHAFGARIVAHDIQPVSAPAWVELMGLNDLLAQSDIVSVHVDLSASTTRLFDETRIADMKRGAILVNTARGDVVDSAALLRALETGWLSGAALDVITGEVSTGVGHLPLVAYAGAHRNLLITPHIGGCTNESMEMTESYLADRVCEALRETP